MKNFVFALAISLAAIVLGGCTTTNSTGADVTASFAPMPDLVQAPVPATKPDSLDAKASLAADVEAGTEVEATTASFAPATGETEAQTQIAAVVSEEPEALETKTKEVKKPVAAKKAIPEEAVVVASAKPVTEAPVKRSLRDRDCLMRAMYFESNRSSRDGQLAVGTVVMHRLAAGKWGNSVCSVVGSPRQFAPGVLTRRMQGDTSDLAAIADALMAGKRHPGVAKNVLFFHTAGLKFPYKNMRYVLVAGGNTFYYKAARKRG